MFLFQIGSWKNITVLFLHSNKLETLPEEMGDMEKLKVINLSDNRFVIMYSSIIEDIDCMKLKFLYM